MKGITVIICCYNSEKRLPKTLQKLAQQQLDEDIPWEVLVIDNASSDHTAEVAHTSWPHLARSNPIYRVLYESTPGLSFARARGIAEAKYDIICFVDDDNWLEEHYLQIAWEIIQANPSIGVLGGRGEAVTEVSPLDWFAYYQNDYAVGQQGITSGDITNAKGFVYGAGIVFRKQALQLLEANQFTSLLSGRKKDMLTAGDDSELCYAIRLAGYRIWYDEKLRFQHFITRERLTDAYHKKLIIGFSKARFFLEPYRMVLADTYQKNKKHVWLREFLIGSYYLIKLLPGYLLFKCGLRRHRKYLLQFLFQSHYCLMLAKHNRKFDLVLKEITELRHRLQNL